MSTPITTRFLVGPPELADADSTELAAFGNIDDAVDYAHRTTGAQVYRCEPMPESAMWEWTVTAPGETPDGRVIYVNERAARSCARPDSTIWKARRWHGPLRWQPADIAL